MINCRWRLAIAQGSQFLWLVCVCVVFLWKDAQVLCDFLLRLHSICSICWSPHRGGCFSASPPPFSTHKTIVPTFLLLWQRTSGHTVPEGNKTIHPLLLVYSGDLKQVWNNNKHTPKNSRLTSLVTSELQEYYSLLLIISKSRHCLASSKIYSHLTSPPFSCKPQCCSYCFSNTQEVTGFVQESVGV